MPSLYGAYDPVVLMERKERNMSTFPHVSPAVQPATTATSTKHSGLPRLLVGLTAASLVGIAVGLYMGLVYAGTDVTQGPIQRIFYIHMPAFMGAFLAFSLAVVGGVMYLRTRNTKWDNLALAGVEVGITLALVNLVTGMIWARPIWNAWWTWDPRLTLEAIMALTYTAYLVLRAGIENPETRRRFASVYGILAIITVILTLIIIRLRTDTIHPTVVATNAAGQTDGNVLNATPGMGAALGVNMIVWAMFVPVTLIWFRIRLQNFAERVSTARDRLLGK
jgi:heme exporter protein C